MKFREGFGKGQSATIGRFGESKGHANYIGKGWLVSKVRQ